MLNNTFGIFVAFLAFLTIDVVVVVDSRLFLFTVARACARVLNMYDHITPVHILNILCLPRHIDE